jgi:hypothetical protein
VIARPPVISTATRVLISTRERRVCRKRRERERRSQPRPKPPFLLPVYVTQGSVAKLCERCNCFLCALASATGVYIVGGRLAFAGAVQ